MIKISIVDAFSYMDADDFVFYKKEIDEMEKWAIENKEKLDMQFYICGEELLLCFEQNRKIIKKVKVRNIEIDFEKILKDDDLYEFEDKNINLPTDFELNRWKKVVSIESKSGNLQPIDITKEQADLLFKSLGFYIEEYSGMCQQTDDCDSGSEYGKSIVTTDYQVYSHYQCDNCGSVILSGHLSEIYNSEIGRMRKRKIHCDNILQ